MTELFSFAVPATTAHLGPGFGVLAIALDLPIQVTVQSSDAPGVKIERRGTVRALMMDARHDEVLRGLQAGAERFRIKLPPNLTVTVDSTVPAACGLGTNTACFVAGLATAVRFAKKPPPAHDVLDLLVELGGDVAHGAAALAGGLTAACPVNAPRERPRLRIIRQPLHASWRFSFTVPETRMTTADARRILPPTLPYAATMRTAGRVLGLLHALAVGDAADLRGFMQDEVHVPFRQRLIAGLPQAIAAGYEAGAAGVTISGHGPGLLAVSADAGQCEAIGAAMAEAFAAAGQRATSIELGATGQGALA